MRRDIDVAEPAVVDPLYRLDIDIQHRLQSGPQKHAHAIEERVEDWHSPPLHHQPLSVNDLEIKMIKLIRSN